MCFSARSPVSNRTTVPEIEIQSYASQSFMTESATRGFASQLRCFTRPLAVLMSTWPSAASTHVIVACGVPSGFIVTNVAKFVFVRSSRSDSVSCSAIFLPLLLLRPRRDRDAELSELFVRRARRGAGQRVGARLRLRER